MRSRTELKTETSTLSPTSRRDQRSTTPEAIGATVTTKSAAPPTASAAYNASGCRKCRAMMCPSPAK